MGTNTIRLHRVFRATPERIYRAFLDADAMTKWLPPNGFTGKVHHMDAKVGGTFKMSFANFTTGKSHSFGGQYLELVPHEPKHHVLELRLIHRPMADADPRLRHDPLQLLRNLLNVMHAVVNEVHLPVAVQLAEDRVPD